MFQLGRLPPLPPPPRNLIENYPENIDNDIYEEVDNTRQHGSLGHSYAIPDESGESSERYDVLNHQGPNRSRRENLNQTYEVNDEERGYVNAPIYIDVNQAPRRQDNYDYSNEYQGLSDTGNVQVLCVYRKLFMCACVST